MSERQKQGFLYRILTTRSIKGFAFQFMKSSMLGQKIVLHNKRLPKVLNISFNEHTCFYKCKCCPFSLDGVRDMYRGKAEMEWKTLTNVVASVPNDPFYSFDISSFGETLLFEPLAEYIRYMKTEKPLVNTVISTNALLLTREKMGELVKCGLDNMQLSLFAPGAEEYRWLCGSEQYERVCDNIRMAAEVREEMGAKRPHLQVFILGSKNFERKFDDFVSYWSRYVDKAFVRPIYNAGLEIAELGPLHTVTKDRYPCIQLWYATSIRSNGDVGMCNLMNFYNRGHKIGNINDDSLQDIWRSSELAELRRLHLSKKWNEHPLCGKCDAWDAYTNVWEEKSDGFHFNITLSDLFTSASGFRGG